jgi:hypothetical protein
MSGRQNFIYPEVACSGEINIMHPLPRAPMVTPTGSTQRVVTLHVSIVKKNVCCCVCNFGIINNLWPLL